MMNSLAGLCLVSCFLVSCASSSSGGGGQQPPGPGARTPLIQPNNPLYGRLEAPTADNDCYSDAACEKSGCSSEVCAAEQIATTCELPVGGWPTQGHRCGCVSGQCIWWH
jgi:eight-cysteine-cluster-containing protein